MEIIPSPFFGHNLYQLAIDQAYVKTIKELLFLLFLLPYNNKVKFTNEKCKVSK
jgi:hypothetical protein